MPVAQTSSSADLPDALPTVYAPWGGGGQGALQRLAVFCRLASLILGLRLRGGGVPWAPPEATMRVGTAKWLVGRRRSGCHGVRENMFSAASGHRRQIGASCEPRR